MTGNPPNESFVMTVSFADLGVPKQLVEALSRQGIKEPFAIQEATIPDGLAGRDLCGKAPTGSGKTLAFGIVGVARLSEGSSRPKRPRMLILTPTRELCAQIAKELQPIATARKLRVDTFYGGVGYGNQLNALRQRCDIAVACPGRLGDLIERGDMRLDEVEVVVVDEADRMADMGFLPEVKRLLDQVPDDRQTLLFSATLDGEIGVLVKRYQKDPARHELEGEGNAMQNATHYFWKVPSTERSEITAEIAMHCGSTIVFCRTKHGADRLARQLTTRGIGAVALHGDRSQAQRERALRSFTRGEVGVMAATDVAARGIHVDNVAVVLHFDPPADDKDYIHRSGRTARAGAGGSVISFVTPEKAKAVKSLQRSLGVDINSTEPKVLDLPKGEPAPKPRAERPDPRPAGRRSSGERSHGPAGHRGGNRRRGPGQGGSASSEAGSSRSNSRPSSGSGSRSASRPGGRPGATPGARPGGSSGGRPSGGRPGGSSGGRRGSGPRSAG